MTPNKLAVYFVADMVLADMVVADIDFPCGRYGFLLWPISSCCGRYGLWPIWSHPIAISVDLQVGDIFTNYSSMTKDYTYCVLIYSVDIFSAGIT